MLVRRYANIAVMKKQGVFKEVRKKSSQALIDDYVPISKSDIDVGV